MSLCLLPLTVHKLECFSSAKVKCRKPSKELLLLRSLVNCSLLHCSFPKICYSKSRCAIPMTKPFTDEPGVIKYLLPLWGVTFSKMRTSAPKGYYIFSALACEGNSVNITIVVAFLSTLWLVFITM